MWGLGEMQSLSVTVKQRLLIGMFKRLVASQLSKLNKNGWYVWCTRIIQRETGIEIWNREEKTLISLHARLQWPLLILDLPYTNTRTHTGPSLKLAVADGLWSMGVKKFPEHVPPYPYTQHTQPSSLCDWSNTLHDLKKKKPHPHLLYMLSVRLLANCKAQQRKADRLSFGGSSAEGSQKVCQSAKSSLSKITVKFSCMQCRL